MGTTLVHRRASYVDVIGVVLCVLSSTNLFGSSLFIALGMSALGLLIHIDPNAAFAPPAVYRNGLAALGIPLGTNFLVTSLIIARIWHLSKRTPNLLPSKSIVAATAVVVESGALLVFAQLTGCVLFVLNHPAQNIAIYSTVQLYVSTSFVIPYIIHMSVPDRALRQR
jgi:hypothetical protein